VLPRLVREADSEWLADALSAHLEQTRGHAERLEAVFVAAGAEPAGASGQALPGARDDVAEPRLRDLALCDAAARTEHLELALYTSLIGLAETLGLDAGPLQANLDEERQALAAVEHTAGRLREHLPA
jgi:ferritin-like metal-binding protein YciE